MRGDRVAEGFELPNVTAFLGRRIDVPLVVIDPQILIARIGIFQQVPDDHQDGAPDGDHCPGLTTPSGDAPVPAAKNVFVLLVPTAASPKTRAR